ncbi:MAG: hypothetical protein LBM28_01895 [Oscillospiraceae bacterium]|jgi:predicted small lipoprotein YifL|nr:hypothetical protein [Oscillospiraceae bacterium]
MKKTIALLLSLCIVFTLCACGSKTDAPKPSDSPNSSPTDELSLPTSEEAQATEPYEVTYSAANSWAAVGGGFWVQTIIEVTNTGSEPLYLSAGSYDLESADGTLLEARSLVSVYPDVINPGEKAYYNEAFTTQSDPGADAGIVPHLSIQRATVGVIRYPVSEVSIRDKQYGGVEAIGRVTNDGETNESMLYVAVVMFDASDKPLGVLFTILTDEVAAGETVGFTANALVLPDDFQAASVARFETYAYPLQMQF